MDKKEKQKAVRNMQAEQAELRETIQADRGRPYFGMVQVIAGILILARSLTTAGFPDAASALADGASSFAFTAMGIYQNDPVMADLAMDAIALADVSVI